MVNHPNRSKRIPIVAAQRVAEQYGYDQVIIIARSVGMAGKEHVTTYGVDKANCDVAARVGNFLKHKIMGWTTKTEWVVVPFDANADMCKAIYDTANAPPHPRFGETWTAADVWRAAVAAAPKASG
jgi:hypothetical protein